MMNVFFLGRQLTVSDKETFITLINKFFGLGRASAFRLASYLYIMPSSKLKDIENLAVCLKQAEELIQREWHSLTERDLRRELVVIKDEHVKAGSYRGLRFAQGLPVKKQRTHTNARTAKRVLRGKVSSQPIKTKK